jgi:hypothetical protein
MFKIVDDFDLLLSGSEVIILYKREFIGAIDYSKCLYLWSHYLNPLILDLDENNKCIIDGVDRI